MIWKLSSSSRRSASRRISVATIADGCASKAWTAISRLLLSYITRTSVRSVAFAPSRGSCWVNWSMSGAFCQAASSSTPSIFGV